MALSEPRGTGPVHHRERRPHQTGADPSPVVAAILAWYARHRRALPWRDAADPYAVWVSEVMLQQTQVATAEPYFRRFMARFPTVADLADAPLADVLLLWQGLGYYARARHLHTAAQAVATDHEGQLPASAAALLRLPGIGRYTAGAVASIAFGEPVPAVDGNIKRFLARLDGVEEDVNGAAGEARIWALAAGLQAELTGAAESGQGEPAAPGDLNQALMELGALICTPRRPRCSDCPVNAHCVAFRDGRQQDLPLRRRPGPPARVTCVALACRRADGRFLVARRPARGLLGGMWEFPLEAERTPRRISPRSPAVMLPAVEHQFSHLRLSVTPCRVDLTPDEVMALDLALSQPHSHRISESEPSVALVSTPGVPDAYDEYRWVTPSELDDLPVSTLMRKLLKRLSDAE